VLPSMTKGEIVGRLVVVIDVNPSHGFWTTRLMKLFGHEGKCTCRYNTHGWIVYIMLFPDEVFWRCVLSININSLLGQFFVASVRFLEQIVLPLPKHLIIWISTIMVKSYHESTIMSKALMHQIISSKYSNRIHVSLPSSL
jgi:hypothetical protein